jgi:hypothetical protein
MKLAGGQFGLHCARDDDEEDRRQRDEAESVAGPSAV